MNLTQLQAAVQALGYETDSITAQTLAINACYRYVTGMQRWPFLEKQDASLSTVVGTAGYTLPMSDWRNLDAVRIQLPNLAEYPSIDYLGPQEFRDQEHGDPEPGVPYFWTFVNQQLRLWPAPDQVYTVVIDYTMEPPDLVAGTDVPVIPSPYQDVLVWGTVMQLAYRQRDWLGRQFAESEMEKMIARMEKEYNVRQRQTSSHVRHASPGRRILPPITRDGV